MDRSVWVPVVSGALAGYAPGFEEWLVGRGYTPRSLENVVGLFGLLSRWLDQEGLGAGDLTSEVIERFLAARRAAGRVSRVSPGCVVVALEYLREVGAAPGPIASGAVGPLEDLMGAYRQYLIGERGVTRVTADGYERVARLFLSTRRDGLVLGRLSAADVSDFVVVQCGRRSVSGAKHVVCALRSLLRYLHVAGVIAVPLVGAVPAVAARRGMTLPRGVEPAVLTRLLASPDRRRTVGRRDYAILLLLARLGLRAGEVAALMLGDVDWHGGEILVRGKGDRHERLPLPADVGQAIAGYLQRRGAPQECRALFVRVRAPRGALTGHGVGSVVHQAAVRAGIAPVGAHQLRHTAATAMLRAGASLPEVAEVLRQRTLSVTAIYAKVDRTALRQLAQPWPEVAA